MRSHRLYRIVDTLNFLANLARITRSRSDRRAFAHLQGTFVVGGRFPKTGRLEPALEIVMRTAFIGVVVIAAASSQIHAVAAAPKSNEIGDLICSLGSREKDTAQKAASGVQVPAAKQNMLCLFRNKETGVEETYHGSFQRSGGGTMMSPRSKTLLWRVSISSNTKIQAGVLDQRYQAEASEANKAPDTVAGDKKPGVSLLLVTESKDDSAFLGLLSLQLKLMASSA